VSLPNYQRPPTAGETAAAFMSAAAPAIGAVSNAWSAVQQTRENAKTTRVVATINANRELGTVQAITGLGSTIATTDAARAPAIQVGAGGVYANGNVQQVGGDIQYGDRTNTTVGGDQTGRDHIVDSHNTTVCTAGDGAPGGNSGNPAGTGASGAGGAGAAGGACGQQGH
jgi:hypothetical protein